MKRHTENQYTNNPTAWQIVFKGTLPEVINVFLTAKRSELLSPGTLKLYQGELTRFLRWLDSQGVNTIDDLTADTIRLYILELSKRRKARSVHIFYRILRTFTYWYERETDNEYKSPIRKIPPPKIPSGLIQGVSPETLQLLIKACKDSQFELRDVALFMFAYDTGCRAAEICGLDIGDIDILGGSAIIRHGKGDKARSVFFGKQTKLSLRRYLKTRDDLRQDSPLFENKNGERFNYDGLRSLLVRRAKDANVKAAWHGFRRGFAREFLLNDGGLVQLQRILGHSKITTTQIYTKLLDADLAESHRKASPVDRLKR